MPNCIWRDALWMHSLEADASHRNLPTVSVSHSSRHPPRTPRTLSKPSSPWPDRLRKGWELRLPTTSLRYKSVKAKEFSPAPLGAAANLVVWGLLLHWASTWHITVHSSGRELCVSDRALSNLMTLRSRVALFHYLSGATVIHQS